MFSKKSEASNMFQKKSEAINVFKKPEAFNILKIGNDKCFQKIGSI